MTDREEQAAAGGARSHDPHGAEEGARHLPPGRRFAGLRPRMLGAAVAIYVATGLLLWLGFGAILTQVTARLGAGIARMQVRANRSIVREPLGREIALARQLAASPLLRSWAADEKNPQLRAQALAELESFRLRFASNTWFYAIDASRHYYFNDAADRYRGKELAYTLDPAKPANTWYFATREKVADYALNVSPSEELGLVKVWVNVVMRDVSGRPLGIAGTGIDLSEFLQRFIDRGDWGVENILVDQDLFIQAHPNRELIDFDSVIGRGRTRLDRLFDPASVAEIKGALSRLAAGQADAEVLPATAEGGRRLVGLASLPELKWYALAVVDPAKVIDRRVFLPLLALAGLALLVFAVAVGWLIDRLILRRLVPLASAAGEVQRGNYAVALAADRSDEIGRLTAAFSLMAEAVGRHTETLEREVQKRTETLERQTQALDEKNRELEDALAHTRRLEGLLPVCAHCKRIRVTGGADATQEIWESLEQHVQGAGVRFSHGLCPDCLRHHYPEYADEILGTGPDAPGTSPR